MNHLTKILLEDILEADNKKITAIYGGGFKPPTKGHFNVIEKAAEQNPEIDDIIIYVGSGERNGIAQGESIQIWELYKKYLPMKVRIEPSKAPVGDVLRYAKDHPEEEVLWIIGARENNPEDFADISSRTRTLDKYPNLQLRVIQTSGGVSGTAARNAVKNNNKEQFFYLIPDIAEKQQVWDIVSPIIKEVGEANLKPYKWEEVDREGYYVYTRFTTDSETQYDVDIKSTVYFPAGQMESRPALEIEFTAKPKGAEGSSAKIVVNKGEMYRVMATIVDIIKKYLKKSKAQAIIYSPSKKSSEENFGAQRDNLYRAFISKAIPGVTFKQSGDFITAILPNTVNELVTDTEVICDNCGWEWSIKDGGDDLYICHKCGHDNNPDLDEGTCGYDTDVKTGKKLDTPGGLEEENLISETMTVYRLGEIPYDEESFFVTPDYKTWIKFYPGEEIHKITTNKLYLPLRSKSFLSWDELRSKYNSGEFTDDDVSYINPEESGIQDFEQYEIKPDDIIDLEQINLEEGRKKKPDPRKGTGKKPEKSGRRLYTDEDPKDTVSIKFKTKEDIVDTLNKTSFKAKSHARQSQVINLIHQRVRAAYGKSKDPEVRSRLKRALDYIEKRKEMSKKKTERLNKMKESSDPFGLNELARQFVNETLKETWKPKESFVSLSKYMIDNGMNIKPLPKIKVIKDDEQNASNLLGKTAYYNPVEKSITLYTMDRHPKDILRSFAHEMIHHEQNLEGKLSNINTTNTNEDGVLPEIEREAYEKGNMMLRNWEDSLKNV
jgi:hypothetical protein